MSNGYVRIEPEVMNGFRASRHDAFTRVYGEHYQRLYWNGPKFVPEEEEV